MRNLLSTRRQVLAGTAAVIATLSACAGRAAKGKPARIDHLIFGVSDLDSGIEYMERATGVRAAVGGTHPGRGTRNALLSLGEGCYFEIFAPDPAQSVLDFPIDLRTLSAPVLVNWAVSGDVDAAAARLRQLAEPAVGPREGSRSRPDGVSLRWRTLQIERRLGTQQTEPLPFMIEWGEGTIHPSADAPAGCRLIRFDISHPYPAELQRLLRAMQVKMPVRRGPCRLSAILETPRGEVLIG